MQPALLKVEQAARYLALGRSKTYELLAPRGPIPVVRIGRSTRVPVAALEAWVAEQTTAREATDGR
jgi:excisionase family DNA binding protein